MGNPNNQPKDRHDDTMTIKREDARAGEGRMDVSLDGKDDDKDSEQKDA